MDFMSYIYILAKIFMVLFIHLRKTKTTIVAKPRERLQDKTKLVSHRVSLV